MSFLTQSKTEDKKKAPNLENVLGLLLTEIESIKGDMDLDKIFEAIGNKLQKIKISSVISVIDEKKQNIIIRYSNLKNGYKDIVVGTKKVKFEKLKKYQIVHKNKKAEFCENRLNYLSKQFEEIKKRSTKLKDANSIISPLVVKNEVIGFLEVFSADIEKKDIDVICNFTRRLTISITNIILFHELRESEKKYKAIYEDAKDGFVIMNGRKKKFTEVNKAMTKITGYTTGELKQMNFIRLFVPEERDKVDECIKARLEGIYGTNDSPMSYETKITTRNKQIRYVRMTTAKIINNDEWFTIIQDITENTALLETIEKSKQHYEQVIDTIQDSICVVDRNMIVVSCNMSFAKNIKRDITEIKGLNCSSTIPTYKNNLFKEHCAKNRKKECLVTKVFNEGSPITFVQKDKSKNGKVYYHRFTIMPTKNDKGEVYQVVIVIRDITERTIAENNVKKLSEFNKRIVNNAPVSIITLDKKGEITSVNNYFKKLSRGSDHLGASIYDLPFIEREGLKEKFKTLLKTGESFHKDKCVFFDREANDEPRYLNISVVPLLDKNYKIDGAISMGVDSTDTMIYKEKIEELNKNLEIKVKKRTDQLKKANEKLNQVLKLKSKFISDASHEIRTPLTIIQGNIDLAVKEAKNNEEEVPEYFQTVKKELERMTKIISDLTMLTNADARTEKLELEIISLNIITKAIAQSVQVLTKQKNIDLTVKNNVNINIIGDETKLEKLLLNIVRNSIKYTDVGGWIKISLEKDDDKARIIVEDNGIGIPKEDLPFIFERFYRVDKARSRDEGGTGLGLSICKWIAEAHGGNIKTESKEGKGTKFIVTLPVQEL